MENSDFVTQFYNLEGDLISERKKNFFSLLKAQSAPLNEDDLKGLCPRTYLESLFQIDIFIYFKISTKLLDVIKGGNEVFISKILKHPSLLMDTIGSISAESFVNDFLPCTSYSIRMKILKRIALVLKEHQMDEIVSAVHKRYGLHVSSKILHTCSTKTIKEYLSNCEIILKPRQLKFIFDKDAELLVTYLEYYKKSTGKEYNHKELCRYVASKDPKMLLMLKKERTITCKRLGRRITKTLIDHDGNDFLNNVEFYSEFLKLDAIVRKLHGNFKEVYFQLFPRNVHEIRMYNFCNTLLKYYPKKNQWDLFSQTFTRVFEKDILDNLSYLAAEFMPFIPNKTILNKLGEVLYNKSKENYNLKLCDPNKAIPLIKEKINVTSNSYERKMLVMLLLENCRINEDLKSLEEVLQYICLRHLDENIYDILEKIKDNFKMEKFNEIHWNYINKMISVLNSRGQLSYYIVIMFALKQIEFLVVHEKSIRKELITYIEEIELNIGNLLMGLKNRNIEKQVLFEVIKIYPDKMEYINDIIHFNEKYPEEIIDISSFPIFVTYIMSLLDRDSTTLENSEKDILSNVINYNYMFPEKPVVVIDEIKILEIFRHSKENFQCDKAVENILRKTNRSEFENEVLQFFWSDLLKRFNLRRKIVQWLFINEPKTIFPHFEQLWSLDEYCIKSRDLKLMSHLSFDKKALDYFTSKLECIDDLLKKINSNKVPEDTTAMEVDDEPKTKIETYAILNIIKYLSTFLTTSGFIEVVAKRFLPVKGKIDPADLALKDIYFLQCEVAGALKKMNEPSVVLPTVMKFCVGDYLQSALPSLYSICYRTPETLLYSYMDTLSKRAVSARKHSLFLSCELLNYNYTLNRLQHSEEKNVSCQKHMFSATLKYFRKNGNEELLNVITINLTKINKHDTETLHDLIYFDVPKIHRGMFIQKCWRAFENLRTEEVEVQYYLHFFLNAIIDSEDNLLSLPIDFCKHIITNYFKDSPENDYDLNDIHRFVCLVLRNLKSEQTDNFKFVFDIITLFKNNNNTRTIKTFFNKFFDIAIQDIKKNSKIDTVNNHHIELFKQYWFNTFTPTKMFDEHVLLNLLYLRCKSFDNLVENYAKEVVIYMEKLVEEYGPYIYGKFKDLVLQKHSFTEKEKYLFLYSILKFRSSTLNCILVLDLLKCQYCCNEIKDIRCQIIEILKNSNQPIVLLNFDNSFE